MLVEVGVGKTSILRIRWNNDLLSFLGIVWVSLITKGKHRNDFVSFEQIFEEVTRGKDPKESGIFFRFCKYYQSIVENNFSVVGDLLCLSNNFAANRSIMKR